MSLFNLGNFILSSGISSEFKIDCDFLTDEDLETIAKIIYENNKSFGSVIGIPTGGLRLSKILQKYIDKTSKTLLIVDDVLTTGKSMIGMFEKFKKTTAIIGVVIFARGSCPDWVMPLFVMNEQIKD